MTTDNQLQSDVLEELHWQPKVDHANIGVKVEHGWVTLSGKVVYHYRRKSTEVLASGINGVKGITNLIEVHKTPASADVRERIVLALKRSADIDARTITVRTEGTAVILDGKVRHQYERRIAEQAAWAAPGVDRVEDNIVVL